MKISYIANIRLPTEKAHGIQIMKTCEAFALQGHEVELIVPRRDNPITTHPFEHYGISDEARSRFSITYLPSVNLVSWGTIGFWLQSWIFAETAALHMRKNWPDVVYSRDFIVLTNMILIHPHLVWEAHQGEDNLCIKLLLKKAKLVAITYGLVELYTKYLKDLKKTLVAPDAVDLSEFQVDLSREECRKKLGLPLEKKIALYWGHLYGWKGVQTLADASEYFNNYEVAVVVGGHEKDIENFKNINQDKQRLLVVGRRPRNEIALFLKAADVVVLPNSGKVKISSHYTSPLKLFEDMASGTPIVASDLPSLREILNEKNAVFFTPDDPRSLHEAVKYMFDNPAVGAEVAAKALEDVQHFTWDKRAQKIAEFIQP